MKVCTRCGKSVEDYSERCDRCGNHYFISECEGNENSGSLVNKEDSKNEKIERIDDVALEHDVGKKPNRDRKKVKQVKKKTDTEKQVNKRVETESIIGVVDWVLVLIQLIIPVYNIFFIIKNGFISDKTDSNIRNFTKAYLTVVIIAIFVIIVVNVISTTLLASIL